MVYKVGFVIYSIDKFDFNWKHTLFEAWKEPQNRRMLTIVMPQY